MHLMAHTDYGFLVIFGGACFLCGMVFGPALMAMIHKLKKENKGK